MEKVQISQNDMQKELTKEGMLDYMSDDDLASSLGFLTTMSEGMMNPAGPTDMQEADPKAGEDTQPQASPDVKKELDSVQQETDNVNMQAEFDTIKSQLEELLAEEKDDSESGDDTETPKEDKNENEKPKD